MAQNIHPQKKWYDGLPKWTTYMMVILFAVGALIVIADIVLMVAFALRANGVSWAGGVTFTPTAIFTANADHDRRTSHANADIDVDCGCDGDRHRQSHCDADRRLVAHGDAHPGDYRLARRVLCRGSGWLSQPGAQRHQCRL
jgi:hypothetical protein